MDRVEDFVWNIGNRDVSWRFGTKHVHKEYDDEVGSAIVLRDGSGVAIVEPSGNGGRNAVVLNADGSERFRISPPTPTRHVTFWEIYYIKDELTAIATTRGNDWATVIDAASGREIRTYETR